jgi:MFS family permease
MLLTVCALVVPAQLYLALPLAPRLEEAWGLSRAAATWATSAFAFSYAAGFLVFGPLSPRLGRRRVLVCGLVILGVATAAAARAPSMPVLLLLRAVQGGAAATLAPVALLWVAEKAPAARRATALAVLTTGLLGAGLAGQLYATGMLSLMSWRWMLLCCAPVYVGLAVLVLGWLEPERGRRTASLRDVYRPALATLWRRETAGVFAVATVVFGSFVGMYGALNAQLSRSAGFTSLELLGVQAIGAVGLLLAPTMRWWAPRGLDPQTQAVLGFLVAASGITLEQLTLSWAVPVAGSVVYVAGISLVVPSLVALLTRHAPDERAAVIGFNTFLLFVGAALAPLLLGSLSYRAALALLATVLCVAAGVISVAVPKLGHRRGARRAGLRLAATSAWPSRGGGLVRSRRGLRYDARR